MNIQSNFGLHAFQSVSKIAPPSQAVGTSEVTANSAANTGKQASDKVTISITAMALAADDDQKARARTPSQERFLQTISDNTAAESHKLAYEMAYSRSEITYDISHGDTRLSSTGELVGEDYAEKFSPLAAAVDAQKRALYESEKAKGTDPREIIAKIIDFQNAQSDAYRVGTGVGFF